MAFQINEDTFGVSLKDGTSERVLIASLKDRTVYLTDHLVSGPTLRYEEKELFREILRETSSLLVKSHCVVWLESHGYDDCFLFTKSYVYGFPVDSCEILKKRHPTKGVEYAEGVLGYEDSQTIINAVLLSFI